MSERSVLILLLLLVIDVIVDTGMLLLVGVRAHQEQCHNDFMVMLRWVSTKKGVGESD